MSVESTEVSERLGSVSETTCERRRKGKVFTSRIEAGNWLESSQTSWESHRCQLRTTANVYTHTLRIGFVDNCANRLIFVIGEARPTESELVERW